MECGLPLTNRCPIAGRRISRGRSSAGHATRRSSPGPHRLPGHRQRGGAAKGGSAPGVERLNTRSRELCEQVGEPRQLFHVLWGFRLMYNARGDYQAMRTLGEQLLSLAHRLEDPDLLLEANALPEESS
jgi:hypothetical protein